MQAFNVSNTTDGSLQDYTQVLADLLSFGQTLGKPTQRVSKRLCQEVLCATHGKARLLLTYQDSSTGRPFPVSVSFPLRFRNRILGVHSERDIPLAAYRAYLFSILE